MPKALFRGIGAIRLEVRHDMPRWRQAAILSASVLAGIAVSAVILIAAGVDAGDLFDEFVVQNLGDPENLASVLLQAVPLICVGLSASVAFRVRFWNLGLEGQMIWGGIGATAVTIFDIGPDWLRLPLMLAAAMLGGMLWVALPLLLKLRAGVNEIITTLLMNYVAGDALLHLLYGAWQDPRDSFPHSPPFSIHERMPGIGGGVNSTLLLVLAATALIWWLVHLSRAGFYMSVVNANPRMARAVGVPLTAITVGAVALSAAMAGLGGFVIVAGQEGRLTQAFYEGYGFSGILIAFLARTDPAIAALVAVLIALLFVTGRSLQVFYQVPFSMVQLIQAIIVISVASSEFFIRHRLHWARRGRS
jgi:general nucleoside transport system permease protein